MSLEGRPEPKPADTTPAPAASDPAADLRAALGIHAARLKDGAAPHLERIFRDEFKGVSPALLPEAIRAKLESPEFALFVRSDDPAPGTLASDVAHYQDVQRFGGGINNVTGVDASGTKTIDLAGSGGAAAIAEAQRPPELIYGIPAAKWHASNGAERLLAIANAFRENQSAMVASSGVVLEPKSK
jgi:hypothetical protein